MAQALMRLLAAAFVLGLAACASSPEDANPDPAAEIDQSRQTEENTYGKRTVLEAGSDVFGEGAEGLAEIVESIFADLGRPNAYIAGREAGGAFVVGLRYGDGVLHHKIEGTREVHWSGPSAGFDFGGDAAKVFTLVYNLYDTEDLFRRYAAVEGQFYFVGGLGASYHKRGDVVVVPIRLGVGLRVAANAGYIKFTKEGTFNPF